MSSKNLASLIRLPNLIMVFLTQLVVFHVLNNFIQINHLNHSLTFINFSLLSICTILIAASGYVINDIYDVDIDAYNKPDKQIVNVHISIHSAKTIYFLLLFAGFAIAVYLSYAMNKWKLLILFPMAALFLFLYARTFKKSFLWGNVLVSSFVAAVPLIILLGASESFYQIRENHYLVVKGVFVYALFGFIANMVREIVKDIEDMEGDKLAGSKTLPLVLGKKMSKNICIILLTTFIFSIIWYIIDQAAQLNGFFLIALLLVLIGSLLMIYELVKAKQKSDFRKISLQIKVMMLFGLISLYLWPL